MPNQPAIDQSDATRPGIDLDALAEMRQQVEAAVEQERTALDLDERVQGFLSDEVLTALESNQDGDAFLFIRLFEDRFCFDHAVGQWYIWSGNFWVEDKLEEVIAAIESVVRIYERERQNQRSLAQAAHSQRRTEVAEEHERSAQELKARTKKLRSFQRKKDVLRIAAAGPRTLGVTGDEWDADPWLVACRNGVLDLSAGELRNGRPDDYIKTVCPVNWEGIDKRAPNWERFLSDIFGGDEELTAYIQRLLGYSITGITSENVFHIFWGQGRNGKSTLMEALGHILGPHAGPVRAEMLLQRSGPISSAGHNADIMALRGKRFVWGSETDEGKSLDLARIKLLTGSDTLSGRPPYGRREISFTPTHKLILLTNHRPRADAYDEAFWHRLRLVPFVFSFVDEPKKVNDRRRDTALGQKLKREASGILAWLVRGCLAWQEQGLNPPSSVKAATQEYRKDEDVLGRFIDTCCEEYVGARVQANLLYKVYRNWCRTNGHNPMSSTRFGKMMKDRLDHQKSSEMYYQDIRLSEAAHLLLHPTEDLTDSDDDY